MVKGDIFEWFLTFLNAFNTDSLWKVIFGGHWISTFDTIFEKHSIEVFTSSLLSDTTFPFSVNVILSFLNVLFERLGCTVFPICLLPVTWKLLQKYFLVCSLHIFRCFLYGICDDIDDLVLSCLNLFNNLYLDMIAFLICQYSLVTSSMIFF